MEWVERLNSAISYIEKHLTDEVDYERAARAAGCSVYHFQRMFAYMADMTLTEYIRRRRMTLAAVDLMNGGEKIVDVALKYGYASPTAFNRAFQNVHGAAPSLVKAGGVSVKSYSPISFKITIKGATEMDYRMEKKEAFRIVGISRPLEREIEKNFEAVPRMWEEAAEKTLPALIPMMDGEPRGVLGVSACNDREEWRYFIAVASSRPAAEPFEEYKIPAFTWAIFSGEGTGLSIQELEQKIVLEWLPGSGYEYADGPDIEVYFNPDPQNTKYEVWIPVVKRDGRTG